MMRIYPSHYAAAQASLTSYDFGRRNSMAESNGVNGSKKKVLITGGAGLIGGILIDRLGDRYELSSLDLKEGRWHPFSRRLVRRPRCNATSIRLVLIPLCIWPPTGQPTQNGIQCYRIISSALTTSSKPAVERE